MSQETVTLFNLVIKKFGYPILTTVSSVLLGVGATVWINKARIDALQSELSTLRKDMDVELARLQVRVSEIHVKLDEQANQVHAVKLKTIESKKDI